MIYQGLVLLVTSIGLVAGGGLRAQPVKFRNVGRILQGVDATKLDPFRIHGGSGIRAPIFAASYDGNHLTADGEYRVPDGLHVTELPACEFDHKGSTFSGENSYMESAAGMVTWDASAGVGRVSGSYQNSRSYEEMNQQSYQSSGETTMSSLVCTVYKAKLLLNTLPRFSQNFLNGVKRIVDNVDAHGNVQQQSKYDDAIGNFVRTFGTHMIKEVNMGSSISQRFTSSREASMILSGSKMQKGTAAQISTLRASVSREAVSNEEENLSEAFSKYSERRGIITTGTAIPRGTFNSKADFFAQWQHDMQNGGTLNIVSGLKVTGIDSLFVTTVLSDFNKGFKHYGIQIGSGSGGDMTQAQIIRVRKDLVDMVENACSRIANIRNCAKEPFKADIKHGQVYTGHKVSINFQPENPRVTDFYRLTRNDIAKNLRPHATDGWRYGIDRLSKMRTWWDESEGHIVLQGFELEYTTINGNGRVESRWMGKRGNSRGTPCEIDTKGEPIKQIRVWTGDSIDGIEFRGKNGSFNTCGKTHSKVTDFYAGATEEFFSLSGRAGRRIDSITFEKLCPAQPLPPSTMSRNNFQCWKHL